MWNWPGLVNNKNKICVKKIAWKLILFVTEKRGCLLLFEFESFKDLTLENSLLTLAPRYLVQN
jgi:hypothetical protein